MLTAVLTSLAVLVSTAGVGAVLVSSERLRSAAATDAGLREKLGEDYEDVAKALSESAARSAMLAAARTNYPPATLSEVLAILAAITGGPVYVAAFDMKPEWLATSSCVIVLTALLAVYAVATNRWCRRAVARVESYVRIGITAGHDAAEATRQLWLTLLLQACLVCISTMLSLLIGMQRITDRDWALGAMLTGIVLGLLATYSPILAMRREVSIHESRTRRALKPPTAWGSAKQFLDRVRHPHLYPDDIASPDPEPEPEAHEAAQRAAGADANTRDHPQSRAT